MADLFRAAESGNIRALKKHLRAGKDCNTQTRSTKATPLIWGARKQQKRVVKVLLQCPGSDPDIQDSNGNTALHYAVRNNDHAVTALLFGHGGLDLELKNNRDEFAFQLADFQFFKRHVLDEHDATIAHNVRERRLADSRATVARLEIEETLQRVARLRQQTWEREKASRRGVRDRERRIAQLPGALEAAEQAAVLQDVLFTRLGHIRAEHVMVKKKTERMRAIAAHMEGQIAALEDKAVQFDTASLAIADEIEELTAGLAAKTDTLTPLRIWPDDEPLQETCVAGLLSLIEADATEAIHQGLAGEKCSHLMGETMARFPFNERLAADARQVVQELTAYRTRMYEAKMGRG